MKKTYSDRCIFFQEHDCKLTQEIIELIDREADLLMRGVRENNLDGLRKRISTLFLQYIKTPTFNPEAAKLLKVLHCKYQHFLELIMKQSLYKCIILLIYNYILM